MTIQKRNRIRRSLAVRLACIYAARARRAASHVDAYDRAADALDNMYRVDLAARYEYSEQIARLEREGIPSLRAELQAEG